MAAKATLFCGTDILTDPVSEDDQEELASAATEVISDFPDLFLSEEYVRCDAPEPLHDELVWVYLRKE